MVRKRGIADSGDYGIFKSDVSLLSNRQKIELLKKNILEADERQNQLLAKAAEFKNYLASERITYAEYEWLLSHYLKGKSLNDWLFYYENYKLHAGIAAEELEAICGSAHSAAQEPSPMPATRLEARVMHRAKEPASKNPVLMSVLILFAVIGVFFLGNAITGFFTVEFPLNESWDVSNSFVRVSMQGYSEDRPLSEFVNGSIVSVELDSFALPASGAAYVDLIVNGTLADSRRVEYELSSEIPANETENITEPENITEMPEEQNATEPETNFTLPPENITSPENITEPLNTTLPLNETINTTEPELNMTEPLNTTLPENISNATVEFNLTGLNLTHAFDDDVVGEIRTGEPVLWQREIIGGEKESESFYKEAENIVLVKKSDLEESTDKGKKGGSAIRAMYADEALKKEAKQKAKGAIEKKGIKLDKKDAGNESYARIEEPEAGADYLLFYETPAPLMETREATPEKITVGVSAALDYENVTVAYPLDDYKSRQISVYWIVNGTRMKMYSVGEDTDGDGVEDNLLWIAPHLSNQTFELEITVINVYESPSVGGNWTVYFNTTGTGNLTIEPFNDLLDG
ncbi:MAG TPA: hypothetical protein HA362_05660, partial [Nanoarchaeota archaeon]|nr:hypothetical protein [Nanoarchaeota archaeon]